MSLILEALRKSEAERQRGRAPDLHTALSAPRAAREPRRGWVVGIVMTVAGITIAGWFWHAQRPTGPTPPAVAPATLSPPTLPTPTAVTAAPPQPAQPSPSASPKAPSDAARPVPIADAPPRLAPPETNTVTVTTVATPPPASAPSPATAMLPDTTPVPQETESLRRLGDLDSSIRAQLPTLKVSMHVWNDDPAQRFALIDGQRLGEGAQIGDALVERIDRDGVVLSWRGERLLLPRP